jgi:hypothetical protein
VNIDSIRASNIYLYMLNLQQIHLNQLYGILVIIQYMHTQINFRIKYTTPGNKTVKLYQGSTNGMSDIISLSMRRMMLHHS